MPPWQHLRLRDRQEREGLACLLLLELKGQLPFQNLPRGFVIGAGSWQEAEAEMSSSKCLDSTAGNTPGTHTISCLGPREAPGGRGNTHSCRGCSRCHSPQRSLPCGAGLRSHPRLPPGCWRCPAACRSGSGCPRLRKETGGTESGCGAALWVSECGSAWGLGPEKPAGRWSWSSIPPTWDFSPHHPQPVHARAPGTTTRTCQSVSAGEAGPGGSVWGRLGLCWAW